MTHRRGSRVARAARATNQQLALHWHIQIAASRAPPTRQAPGSVRIQGGGGGGRSRLVFVDARCAVNLCFTTK